MYLPIYTNRQGDKLCLFAGEGKDKEYFMHIEDWKNSLKEKEKHSFIKKNINLRNDSTLQILLELNAKYGGTGDGYYQCIFDPVIPILLDSFVDNGYLTEEEVLPFRVAHMAKNKEK